MKQRRRIKQYCRENIVVELPIFDMSNKFTMIVL